MRTCISPELRLLESWKRQQGSLQIIDQGSDEGDTVAESDRGILDDYHEDDHSTQLWLFEGGRQEQGRLPDCNRSVGTHNREDDREHDPQLRLLQSWQRQQVGVQNRIDADQWKGKDHH